MSIWFETIFCTISYRIYALILRRKSLQPNLNKLVEVNNKKTLQPRLVSES